MRQWMRVLTSISRPDNEQQLKNGHPTALGLGFGDEIHWPSFTAPDGEYHVRYMKPSAPFFSPIVCS
jgi:hypothetical protein